MSSQQIPSSSLGLIQRLSVIFLSLMVIVPFLIWHHRQPLSTFYPEVIAIGLGLLALIWCLDKSSWQDFRMPLSAVLPLTLVILMGVQYLLEMHIYWQDYFLNGLVLLWAGLMMILGRNIDKQQLIPVMAWAMVVGGFLTAFLMVMQLNNWTNMPFVAPHVRGGFAANIGQVNHAATYLALALGSLIYLLHTQRIHVVFYLTVLIILLAALVLTGQRMATLYVVSLALFAPLLLRKLPSSRPSGWWVFLMLPVFLLLDVMLPYLISDVIGSPMQRVIENVGDESIRLLMIQQAWQMFTENPWLGVGFGSFGWQNLQLTESYPGLLGYVDNAHNIIMQLLAEFGLVAGAVFLLLAGLWIIGQFRSPLTAERCWVLFLLGVLALHSMLEYPLWYSYFLGIAALLVGMGEPKSLKLPQFRLGQPLTAGVVVFSLLILTGVVKQYHELESWYTDRKNGEMSDESAIDFLYMLAERRDSSLFAPFFDVIIVRALPNNEEIAKDKLAMNTQFMKFLPGEIEVFTQVDLLVKTGQQDAASEHLDKAIRQFPEMMDWYWKSMTRSLLVDRDTRYFPLIQQLQEYQDDYLGIEDYR